MAEINKESLTYLVGLGEKLEDSKRKIVETDHGKYMNPSGMARIMPDLPDVQHLQTLDGLADLIGGQYEKLDKLNLLLHVKDEVTVVLTAKASDEFGRRPTYVQINAFRTEPFKFGQYLSMEDFIVQVMARFVDNEDKKYVLMMASKITSSLVQTAEDDGISQSVGVQTGLSLKQRETLRSPVTLAPFRTFREVKQPESAFVFRARQARENEAPTLALFEADGGKWKIDAVNEIARYLRTLDVLDGITLVS